MSTDFAKRTTPPAQTTDITVGVTGIPDGHLVQISGDIDMATAPRLAEHLAQFANGNVTVDLSQVGFLDSSGLSALVAAHRHITRRGAQLTLTGLTPSAQRIIQLTGLDQYLHLDGQGPT